MKNANIDNGKQVLQGIIDSVRRVYDGSDHIGESVWQESIEQEMEIMQEADKWDDLRDLMAYVLQAYDGDTQMLACIACYGIAWCIADAMTLEQDSGETSYLLK